MVLVPMLVLVLEIPANNVSNWGRQQRGADGKEI